MPGNLNPFVDLVGGSTINPVGTWIGRRSSRSGQLNHFFGSQLPSLGTNKTRNSKANEMLSCKCIVFCVMFSFDYLMWVDYIHRQSAIYILNSDASLVSESVRIIHADVSRDRFLYYLRKRQMLGNLVSVFLICFL